MPFSYPLFLPSSHHSPFPCLSSRAFSSRLFIISSPLVICIIPPFFCHPSPSVSPSLPFLPPSFPSSFLPCLRHSFLSRIASPLAVTTRLGQVVSFMEPSTPRVLSRRGRRREERTRRKWKEKEEEKRKRRRRKENEQEKDMDCEEEMERLIE